MLPSYLYTAKKEYGNGKVHCMQLINANTRWETRNCGTLRCCEKVKQSSSLAVERLRNFNCDSQL